MVGTRRRSRWILGSAVCIAVSLMSANGWAGDDEAPTPDGILPDFERRIEREVGRMFDHLQGVLEDLPRYALPEMTEDGDIIIRRVPRNAEKWPREPQGPDEILDL